MMWTGASADSSGGVTGCQHGRCVFGGAILKIISVTCYNIEFNYIFQVLNEKDEILHWICATDSDQASEKAQTEGIDLTGNVRLEQDEDVLDTWFSSAILPFANFGWPDNNETTSQSGNNFLCTGGLGS